jgi:hypothetical protein
LWGDGFEIETLIHLRVAEAGLQVVEIPSFEHSRIYGVSNLDAFSDGLRVLTTILTERSRGYLRRLFKRRVPGARTGRVPIRDLVHAEAVLARMLYVLLHSVEHDPSGAHPEHGHRIARRHG